MHAHSQSLQAHTHKRLAFVWILHNTFRMYVFVCVCVLTDFLLFAFYVFNRFCFLLLLMLFLLRMQKWICKIFFVCFSFIIDIISLVFVLLFQFPYILTRFTLCNVAIYSMYNYLRWLSRSFCFCFILLLIRFLLTSSSFNCLQNKVFSSSFSLMCVYFQALFNDSLRSAE